MIYFAAVPDSTSLPPLPSGTNMVRSACLPVASVGCLVGLSTHHSSTTTTTAEQVTLAKYKYVSELPQLAFSEPAEAKTS